MGCCRKHGVTNQALFLHKVTEVALDICSKVPRLAVRQGTNKQTNKLTNKQTDRQTDRQTDK